MDEHKFTITVAGYALQFSGPHATDAADSFLCQFRERVELIGQAAAIESVANWCASLLPTMAPTSTGKSGSFRCQPKATLPREARGEARG